MGERGWKEAQGPSIICAGIPRGPDEPDCGWKVLRPGCQGRQGVIIYPHKVLRGCYFFINNFLWAQRCPQPRHLLIGCFHPLHGPAAASKAGSFFGCGGIGQLAPASSLLCPVSQRDAWSAGLCRWPGPRGLHTSRVWGCGQCGARSHGVTAAVSSECHGRMHIAPSLQSFLSDAKAGTSFHGHLLSLTSIEYTRDTAMRRRGPCPSSWSSARLRLPRESKVR